MTHPVDEQNAQQTAQKPTPRLVCPGGALAQADVRRWVWFSSPESFARGQRSVLAVAEIPFSMMMFWGVVAHYSLPWMTLIALLAAPLLLLRSPESIERGVGWLRAYWVKGEGPLPGASQELLEQRHKRQARRLLQLKRAMVAFVVAVVAFYLSELMARDTADGFLLVLMLVLMFVGLAASTVVVVNMLSAAFAGAGEVGIAVAIAIAIAIAIAFATRSPTGGVTVLMFAGMVGVVVFVVSAGVGAVAIAVVVAVAAAFAFAAPSVNVDVDAGLIMFAATAAFPVGGALVVVFFRRVPMGERGDPFSVLGYTLGVTLRCLVLRMAATLRELPGGLRQYSANCRESMLVMDLFHVPELMPGASTVSPELDVASYWRRRGEKPADRTRTERWTEGVLKLCFWLLIYLPTLAYRLNLKANAWLWGLIAWVFSPAHWPGGDERMRHEMAISTHPWLLTVMAGALLVPLACWLMLPWVSASPPLVALFRGHASMLRDLSLPLASLRYAAVWAFWIGMVWLFRAAFEMRATHPKALESPKEHQAYESEDKARFAVLARPVQRRLTLCTALAVLVAWVFILWAATLTDRYQDVVWAWLRPWL